MEAVQILLVEDNLGDVKLTSKALARGKIANELHVARDGVEALDFVHQRNGFEDKPRPDLVLLDLNLPRVNGREVLESMKGNPALRHIPVIVLTTSTAEDDVLASYNLHANCYIQKPIEMATFLRVIQAVEEFFIEIVRRPLVPPA